MSNLGKDTYRIVGHRGNPADFPENSREGVTSIVQHKVDALEVDIQLSEDACCMVVHDDHTRRVSGLDFPVNQTHSSVLTEISVHEPDRFADLFWPSYLLTLKEFCKLLARYRGEVFLELKPQSLALLTGGDFVDSVVADSHAIARQRRFISYDYHLVKQAKDRKLPCGWVMDAYSEHNLMQAQQLNPDYLIIDKTLVPDEPDALWSGNWKWFLYDIECPHEAQKWATRGARYIESWSPLKLQQTRDIPEATVAQTSLES